MQTLVRGEQARRNYAVLVVEHREAAKLENQILALQRKLDEERKARLEMEEVILFFFFFSAVLRCGEERCCGVRLFRRIIAFPAAVLCVVLRVVFCSLVRLLFLMLPALMCCDFVCGRGVCAVGVVSLLSA